MKIYLYMLQFIFLSQVIFVFPALVTTSLIAYITIRPKTLTKAKLPKIKN